MSYFPPYIDADGIHIPTYDDIMTYLLDNYRSIFGEDVNLDVSTMDYQLLSIFARVLDDYSTIAVQNYNARSPGYATGDSLDVLMTLTGLSRKQATPSKVVLSLTGTENATIPAGSQAMDEEGYLWTLDNDCVLDSEGEGTVDATCETAGNIKAVPGTITSIYTPLPDWSSVTNEVTGAGGTDKESDDEMRIRRAKTLVRTNNGSKEAFVRALTEIDGVKNVSIVVNDTDDTDETTGVTPHSVCAVVDGGENADVAQAIFDAKAPGVGTYGTTTVAYTDSFGMTNQVKFTRPTSVPIAVNVSIEPDTGYDADRVGDIIKESIIDDISNLGIGATWRISDGYKDIYTAFGDESIPFSITGIFAVVDGVSYYSKAQCEYNEKFGEVTVIIDDDN